jgi:hypothetical protein
VFKPNDLYPLKKETFRLYYTSHCTDQQSFDVCIVDNGTMFLPNDLYLLNRETFRLYYTSYCSEQQTIGIYIEDEHGQVVQKTFGWQSEDTGNKDENDLADINSLGE